MVLRGVRRGGASIRLHVLNVFESQRHVAVSAGGIGHSYVDDLRPSRWIVKLSLRFAYEHYHGSILHGLPNCLNA